METITLSEMIHKLQNYREAYGNMPVIGVTNGEFKGIMDIKVDSSNASQFPNLLMKLSS